MRSGKRSSQYQKDFLQQSLLQPGGTYTAEPQGFLARQSWDVLNIGLGVALAGAKVGWIEDVANMICKTPADCLGHTYTKKLFIVEPDCGVVIKGAGSHMADHRV